LRLPQTNPATPGIAPFVLSDACTANPTGAAVAITVSISPTTGNITRTAVGGPGIPGCAVGANVGRFVLQNAATITAIRTVGGMLPAPNGTPCNSPVAASFTARYGSVSSTMTTGPNRIIGFARVNFTRVAVCPGPGRGGALPPFTATITRQLSAVAPSDATAILSAGL